MDAVLAGLDGKGTIGNADAVLAGQSLDVYKRQERVYQLEASEKNAHHRIDELREEMLR